MPRSYNASVIAKACASHGALKTGPAASHGNSGKVMRSSGRFSLAEVMSVRLGVRVVEVRFPAIDAYRCCSRIRTPEFNGIETHGIEPLRLLTQPDRIGIGKDVGAMLGDNPSPFAAAVARQPRMRQWMHLMGPHDIADLETCSDSRRTIGRTASQQRGIHLVSHQNARYRARRTLQLPRLDFLRCHKSCTQQEPFQSSEPDLVVTAREVLRR